MTTERLNPADPDYQIRKLKAQIAEAAAAMGVIGDPTDPGNPAGWFEADPDHEGGIIYHPPAGVVVDQARPSIDFSSNLIPDVRHPGGATILQTL